MEMRSDNTENKRCKDCKYFKKEALKRSRSGICNHEMWKVEMWGGTSPLIGINTTACHNFKKRV
jgi:hypothetical protein